MLTFRNFKVLNVANSIACFIAGALAGAATALLLAPESGEKTREKIKKGAAEVASTAKSKLAEGLDAVEGALAKQKGM